MLNIKRYIKFLIVGAVGVVINYLVFSSLRIIIPLDIAWLIGICASATINYILNEWWTFKP